MGKLDCNVLSDIFYIDVPAKKKKTRKSKIIQELESRGYVVEKCRNCCGNWEVYKEGDCGSVAVYDRLRDIDMGNPV
jgi:hypothetical protein